MLTFSQLYVQAIRLHNAANLLLGDYRYSTDVDDPLVVAKAELALWLCEYHRGQRRWVDGFVVCEQAKDAILGRAA